MISSLTKRSIQSRNRIWASMNCWLKIWFYCALMTIQTSCKSYREWEIERERCAAAVDDVNDFDCRTFQYQYQKHSEQIIKMKPCSVWLSSTLLAGYISWFRCVALCSINFQMELTLQKYITRPLHHEIIKLFNREMKCDEKNDETDWWKMHEMNF